MRGLTSISALAYSLLLVLLLASNAPARAGDTPVCFPNWTAAGVVLRSEKLADPAEVRANAEKALGGSVLRMSLCEVGKVYRYRLVVVDSAGTISTILVDAKTPFAP